MSADPPLTYARSVLLLLLKIRFMCLMMPRGYLHYGTSSPYTLDRIKPHDLAHTRMRWILTPSAPLTPKPEPPEDV